MMGTGQGKLPQELVTDNALLKRKYESEELGGAEPVTAISSGTGVTSDGGGVASELLSVNDHPMLFARSRQSLSIGILGDSISKMCFDYPAGFGGAAGDTAYANYGWFGWMVFWSRADVRPTLYAVSGSTTQDVIDSQLTAALAANHDVYTLAPIGINDAVTGAVSVANIQYIARRILSAGKRLLLATPTGVDSYTTSKSRISTIMAGMRALAVAWPDRIRLADFHMVNADPGSISDGAGYQTLFDDVTYDTTHPTVVGASYLGRLAHDAIRDWLAPYQYPKSNGDTPNLLANPQLGGIAGTITNAGTNSVAPTNWTIGRGSANVAYSAYKARTLPLLWKTATTYPVGARIAPASLTGYHYIVLTSAATGATIPTDTTMWGQSTPDVGGPAYLTVPANDTVETPDLGEQTIITMTSSSAGASDYVVMSQSVSAAALVGQEIQVGILMEALGTPWGAAMLRVQQLNSGSAKIRDHFGMGANYLFGTSQSPHSFPHRNARGLIVTPKFVVDPACASINLLLRVWGGAGTGLSQPTRLAFSDAFMV